MMLVPWPVVEASRDVFHRRVLRAGVVLGDHHQRGRQNQADSAGAKQGHLAARRFDGIVRNQPLRDKEEGDQRQDAGHSQALVQRRHHVLHAGRGLDKEAADDGGHDRHRAECQRVHHSAHAGAGDHQGAEHHGGNQRDGVGFKQVGGHAGAVAHVVAHVVGNHGRVARIVLGNAGFDLAHQVGADVSALGENAAAEPGKDRDQR